MFAWLADRPEPPAQWDLRRVGWTLARVFSGEQVRLVDMRESGPDAVDAWLAAGRDLSLHVFLGVESGLDRARLIEAGCGDALSGDVTLRELGTRVRRIASHRQCLPRSREIGALTLDLLHRDARAGERWLALHPREFELLWRLADRPGERVSRARLLREVWRLDFDPGTNTVEVHVSRLRTKLAAAGAEGLVETDPQGGYRVAPVPEHAVPRFAAGADQRLCA